MEKELTFEEIVMLLVNHLKQSNEFDPMHKVIVTDSSYEVLSAVSGNPLIL
jgi:hypothetical protein